MMLVEYLIDSDTQVVIPASPARRSPSTTIAPRWRSALEQERTVTEQIAALVQLAREEGEHVGEHFLGWFLDEQREEVASMSHLLAIIDRAGLDHMLLVEDYLARGGIGAEAPSSPSPPAAGGAL